MKLLKFLLAWLMLLAIASCGGGHPLSGSATGGLRETAAASSFTPQTGVWWDPSASGSGYGIEVQGTQLSLTLYLYGATGQATWYSGILVKQTDGGYAGSIGSFSGGQSLAGAYKAPTGSNTIGSVSLTFSTATAGTLVYQATGGSAAVTVSIQRYSFSTPGIAAASSNFQNGVWWAPSQSGRGFFIESQGDLISIGSYMYDSAGLPVWYTAIANLPSNGATASSTVKGTLRQFANGQTLGGVYRAPSLVSGDLGSLTFAATSATTANLTLPNGILVALVRYTFGDTGTGTPAVVSTTPSTVNSPTPVTFFTDRTQYLLPIRALGNFVLPKAVPVVIDTGSAGLVLSAQAVLPANLVSTSGFVFANGQASIEYQGITVTSQQVTKCFCGGSDLSAHSVYKGNIAFATVTFGGNGELTTKSMPIFLYYTVEDGNGLPFTAKGINLVPGVFGVNASRNLLNVTGAPTPTGVTICSAQSKGSCNQVSPMHYLQYGPGISAGLMLSPTSMNASCNWVTATGCSNTPALTVGLNSATETGFSVLPMTCTETQIQGSSIANLSNCLPRVTGTITIGTNGPSYSGPVAFDTGAFGNFIDVPSTSSAGLSATPATGTSINVALANGYNYSYITGASNTVSSTQLNLNSNVISVLGVNFFNSHSFFIDLGNYTHGFK